MMGKYGTCWWTLLLLVFSARVSGDGSKETTPVLKEDAALVFGDPGYARMSWTRADQQLRSTVNKIVRKALPAVMKEVYKKDISSECLNSLLQLTTALRQSKVWAFQMLDSSGRFPEGFLSGTFTALGDYNECLRIQVNDTRLRMRGQYCLMELVPPSPVWKPFTSMHGAVPEVTNISAPDSVVTYLMGMLHNVHVVTPKIGICTPSLCTTEDINKLIQIIPEKLGLDWKFSVKKCEVEEANNFTGAQLIVLAIFGVVVAIVVMGTVADILWSVDSVRNKSLRATVFQAVRAFSFAANARKLSAYSCPQEPIAFCHGIIFFVFYWVAISNTFMYVNYDVTSNFVKAFEVVKEYFYEVVLNRVVPLQALFFVSGLMTTYRWLKSPEENLSIWRFLLRRYFRYTLTYALIIGLMIITPTWGSGPTWKSHMDPVYHNCLYHGWYNLLYINNFMDSSKVCMDHTWVLAVDAQLHLIAVLILVPLKRRPRIGLTVTCLLGLTGLLAIVLGNIYYDLPPNEALAYLHSSDRHFYAEHSYHRVYTHLILYCAGVLVAYLMHSRPDFKVPKKWTCLGWLLSLAAILTTCLSVHLWREGNMPGPAVAALYAAFSRAMQAGFLAWVAVVCMTGQAAGLRDVLSWRPFSFFSRLIFIGYILYVPLVNMVMSFKKSHMYITDLELFYVVLNHVSGTMIVSYILFVCCEAPFLSLAEMLRRGRGARTLGEKTAPTPKLTILKRWTRNCENNNC